MTTLREQPALDDAIPVPLSVRLLESCVWEAARRVASDMDMQAQHHGIAVERLFACDPRLELYRAVRRMGERGWADGLRLR
jgi:hypothetical protein